MDNLSELIAKATGLHDKIAADVPQIARGIVWCTHFGSAKRANGAACLRSGWQRLLRSPNG